MSTTIHYTLAGVCLFASLVVTILNGLVYAALQSAPHAPGAGLAPVALGFLTCAALISLNVILHKEIRNRQQRPRWKQAIFYFTGAYLLIAAASTTGTIAKDELQSTASTKQSLFIARSIFWALAVFMQGLYFGYLIIALVEKGSTTAGTWPHPYTQDIKLESLPDSPTTITPPNRVCTSEEFKFDTRRSSLRKYPRRSHRFSGGTLCLQPTTSNTTTSTTTTTTPTERNGKARPNSFETTSSNSTITPQSQTQTPTESTFPQTYRDTHPLLRNSIRSMPSLRRDNIPASLDSLVRPGPGPASSSYLHPEPPSQSPCTPTFEQNIHPLFRTNSPSGSPTPSRGTSVKASPSAGQIITQQALTRMRSARSLGEKVNSSVPSSIPSPGPSPRMMSPEEERVMAFMSGK
ncbi:hypothetical protein PENSTE_c001G06082 [Penicillium steckii]|uniref:Uncharacterized protein n=1 Tax=Penicillium steckii TaxID=303698 RepID=A0A1V6U0L3_9EURO|nr:hypothetical protein PENSTE_c001G06082 [Penicillium steckii]